MLLYNSKYVRLDLIVNWKPEHILVDGFIMGRQSRLAGSNSVVEPSRAYIFVNTINMFECFVILLIIKGKKDNFYVDKQLLPENLVAACTESKMEVVMRMQEVGEIRVIILYQQHFINSTVSTSTYHQQCFNSTVSTALYQQHCIISVNTVMSNTLWTTWYEQHCMSNIVSTTLNR